MMPTSREKILAALQSRLSALPATAIRGDVLPERVPNEGLLILRDCEPGVPEVTLSPLAYLYQHRTEIEAVMQGTDRDAAFDTLIPSIGAALAADRTLGSLCDWVKAEAPHPVALPVEGAASLKAAVIPVVLHYSTDEPLGGTCGQPEGRVRQDDSPLDCRLIRLTPGGPALFNGRPAQLTLTIWTPLKTVHSAV